MIWRRRFVIFSLFWLTSTSGLWAADESSRSRPNIVYILADDLGYGDVQCLNPQRGKIKTPHLDRLASHGMTFTDAHSGSSVCTPTRYGLLTGRYAWRSRLQAGVLDGTDDPQHRRSALQLAYSFLISPRAMLDRSVTTVSSLPKKAAPGWPSRCSSGL